MGGNLGHEGIRFLIMLDPLSNGVFPFLGDADHPAFFAIAYAQIQGDVFLSLRDTLTAWISTGPCHRDQRAAQESFRAGQLRQLRTGLSVFLGKVASMSHTNPFDEIG